MPGDRGNQLLHKAPAGFVVILVMRQKANGFLPVNCPHSSRGEAGNSLSKGLPRSYEAPVAAPVDDIDMCIQNAVRLPRVATSETR